MAGFQMWDHHRRMLLAEHRFYLEQARQRLLSQFDNIASEADRAAEDYLATMAEHFNPDIHDPADAYDAARSISMEFHQSLVDLHQSIRLSVVAGMFHHWDKNLREWIVQQQRFSFPGKHGTRAIWHADFPKLMDFVVAMGFDVKRHSCHTGLNALRLVVNVFKHGSGASLDELKSQFPEFLAPLVEAGQTSTLAFDFRDHRDLSVAEGHIDFFSEAIIEFWTTIPGELTIPDAWDVPDWFEKAVRKDRARLGSR